MPNPETIRRESDDSERMAHVIALMFAARGPGRDSSARQAQRPPNPGVHGVRRGATRRRMETRERVPCGAGALYRRLSDRGAESRWASAITESSRREG
jgi:hypothetical protein